ncbi:sulfite exporter TauE/SafE family protein [Mesorhizobium sp. A556]
MSLSDPFFVSLAVLAAFSVGLSKGGLPVVGSLAVPLLTLSISPVVAAGMLLPIYVGSDLIGLWLYRRHFSRRNLTILIPAGLAGVFFGWLTAEFVSSDHVMLLVGAVGLFYCVSSFLAKPDRAPSKAAVAPGLVWGTLSGLSSFVAHSGGGPFQVYVLPQKLEKLVFAGTSTILFAVINVAKLLPYWALGELSANNTRITLWLLPVSIVGAYVGAHATRIIPDLLFFRAVKIVLAVISIKLIYDGLT